MLSPARLSACAAAVLVGLVAAPALAAPADELPALRAQVTKAPTDVDARLKLGLALAAANRWPQAETELRQVIAQAPTYWDAHIALARIAFWRGDLAEAERRLEPVALAAPEPPDAAVLRGQIKAARGEKIPAWRMDLGVAYSDLSRGLDPWREATVSLSRPIEAGGRDYVAGSVQAAERFDRTDVYVEGLYGHGFGADGEAYVAVGGTPNADFRPELQVRAGVTAPLNDNGLSGGLHLALAKFPTEETAGLRGTLRQSFMEDRFAVAGSLIQVWTDQGASLTGYAVQAEGALSRRVRVIVGYSDAPESSDGTAIDVEAVTAGLRVQLPRGRALGLTYTHENRGAYKRKELALSTTLRF